MQPLQMTDAAERKVKMMENEYFKFKKIELLHLQNFKLLIQIIGSLTKVIF
jgi:hypothetical protein